MTKRNVVLLLFLMKAALATWPLYLVTGIGYDGVYEEKREPKLHYKKVGEADTYGYYFYLSLQFSRQKLTVKDSIFQSASSPTMLTKP